MQKINTLIATMKIKIPTKKIKFQCSVVENRCSVLSILKLMYPYFKIEIAKCVYIGLFGNFVVKIDHENLKGTYFHRTDINFNNRSEFTKRFLYSSMFFFLFKN